MKLTPDNMRAMCDWVVADKGVFSHRFEDREGWLSISIDTAEGSMVINQNEWLTKNDKGIFKVVDK